MYLQRNSQQTVIDLKLWVFKFICNDKDEFAVCVEGYRKKDIEERELENWRSTAIKKRYNSQTLFTVTGSKYILHGVLDQDSAYGLGYPKTLIERFKDGFPYEWRELLCDYYNNVVKPNKLNASQKLHSVLLNIFGGYETSLLSSSNTKRGHYLLIKDKIVEEDEGTSKDELSASKFADEGTDSTSKFSKTLSVSPATLTHHFAKQEVKSKYDNRYGHKRLAAKVEITDKKEDKPQDDTLFKMPLLPLQRCRPKPVELYNWTVRFSANDLGHSKLFSNFAFVIVGFRPDKNLDWKTSCIIAVEDSRLLRTETGDYRLVGPINTILAAQQGFPKEFVAQFLNGFPKDWHRILSLFFHTYIEPQLPPHQSLTISEIHEDDETENLHRRVLEQTAKNDSSDENNRENDHAPTYKRSSKYRQSNSPALSAKRVKLEEVNAAKNSVDLSLLKTTRSGRAVKPRLATWTGQRIVYNVHGSPVKTIGITTDSIYSTSTSDVSSWSATGSRTNLQKTARTGSKFPLVAYSDSMSCSSDDTDDGSLLPPSPVTPFCGKRGPHVSRIIISSPEQNIEKKPVKKVRKRRTRTHGKLPPKRNTAETVPIVSFSDVESENGVVENERASKSTEHAKMKNAQQKKWTENDNIRLKLAVRAMHPQSDKDWENIAASMRARTAEECRRQALEVLKLNVTARENTPDVSADVLDALKKTRVGTLAYQIQADRFTRQYLKAGDGSDFFEETMDAGPSGRKVALMPSVTTFDSDDSLLSVLRTPTPKFVRRNNRRAKLIQIAESPISDSTPKSTRRDSYVPFRFDPEDETYRERQLRYVHKMLKVKTQHGRNRANTTKLPVSNNYHLRIPAVTNQQNDSDRESEEDEYFEEEGAD
uniref:Myb-like domain-containing protein n=1 Tax=Setaria digitata TaxID=48799 RepID=A0A915PU32_9BILA